MRRRCWRCGLVWLGIALAGCATTGDPRQGGLFGWSETKARTRQREREDRLAHTEGELASQKAQRRVLESRELAARPRVAASRGDDERSAATSLRQQQAALLARTEELEAASPTPATASRARAYRAKVNETMTEPGLSLTESRERLRKLGYRIDGEFRQLGR